MDPMSQLAMMGVGLFMQMYGSSQSSGSADQYNQAQMGVFQTETKVNQQRRLFMEMDWRRKSMENLRNVQNARAMSLAGATAQGAQFGSGLQGGYAQVSSEGAWNQLNLNQGVEIGRKIFGLDDQMNRYKLQMAQAQSQMQQGSAMSSFGSSMMGAAPALGKITSGFGGQSNNPNPYQSYSDPNGNLGGLY